MTEHRRDLGAVLRDHLAQWRLRPDGPIRRSAESLVAPVVTDENTAAVIKVSRSDPRTEHEHLVLRRWAGNGSVRLLRADPPQGTVLLERLHPQTLATLPDTEACEVVAGLYRRLHVPAMPQLPSLTSQVAQWVSEVDRLPRNAPIPHRLVEQAAGLGRDLASDNSDPGVVLHGDLHYRAMLAADRQPWLAISPRALNGDPHYELAPMLWHRWEELADNVRDGVRRRFHTLVDAAGFDEQRARAWTLIRVAHTATRQLVDGKLAGDTSTRYVAIAKAIQD